MRGRGTADLIREFVSSTGSAIDGLDVATISDSGQERSFARFTDSGRDWFAGFLVIGGGAVLASANVPAGDQTAFRRVEVLVASIAPAPKKDFFHRR
jgi:hypothetical protein